MITRPTPRPSPRLGTVPSAPRHVTLATADPADVRLMVVIAGMRGATPNMKVEATCRRLGRCAGRRRAAGPAGTRRLSAHFCTAHPPWPDGSIPASGSSSAASRSRDQAANAGRCMSRARGLRRPTFGVAPTLPRTGAHWRAFRTRRPRRATAAPFRDGLPATVRRMPSRHERTSDCRPR